MTRRPNPAAGHVETIRKQTLKLTGSGVISKILHHSYSVASASTDISMPGDRALSACMTAQQDREMN